MILVLDNYDSFTWNLVQYLGELGAEPRVVRNDEATVDEILALAPERIVVSPGPCTPAEAGVSVDLIRAAAPRVPLLGVCLGHQAMGEAFGGRTIRAASVMHGKTGPIRHLGEGIFQGLPSPFTAARYHSLVTDPEALPEVLVPVAWSEAELREEGRGPGGHGGSGEGRDTADEIQAMRHRGWPAWGVQFHPESLFSSHGKDLLENFLRL
jgi:anthranilate synthase component II